MPPQDLCNLHKVCVNFPKIVQLKHKNVHGVNNVICNLCLSGSMLQELAQNWSLKFDESKVGFNTLTPVNMFWHVNWTYWNMSKPVKRVTWREMTEILNEKHYGTMFTIHHTLHNTTYEDKDLLTLLFFTFGLQDRMRQLLWYSQSRKKLLTACRHVECVDSCQKTLWINMVRS